MDIPFSSETSQILKDNGYPCEWPGHGLTEIEFECTLLTLLRILSRLDYFDYINVKTLWLSPVYQSPMVDFGYDVMNHTQIDPIFGTMADFEELLRKMHEKGQG
ncbi:hypothetical protein CHS0354_020630 [Potamilus streckersoni]|uniref:Glycosyl hydrolase family 13 catalytic domain-containing protein n=1 Tax=Potamilus streckersoni TaxID=2493646 RepID=A0AAE0T2E3_9BIVA|nr:hypothetical protein CHS0354_020630 [Potamilus streckersoni]